MAKRKRVRKAITGVLCGACLLISTLVCAAIVLLSLAMVKTGSGESPGLFGYSIFLNQQNTPSASYTPGTAIFIKDLPHEELLPGDLILCEDLDTENRYYPIIYRFFEFDPSQPITLTVEALDDGEILSVNRDYVIGKCVGSSHFLGSVLQLIRDDERGFSLLAIALGGLGVLFVIALCGYLVLRRSERKKAAAFLPEEPVTDLFAMVEEEADVSLILEPLPEQKPQDEPNEPTEETNPQEPETASEDLPAEDERNKV